ncbi:MAG: hypothetical protein ACWA5K_00610 [bacterium]
MSARERYKPKILIHGVGQYGKLITQIAVRKGFSVVAAVNRAGSKVGQDLGRVAGLDRDLGVIVEDIETADYAAMQADIAIDVTLDKLEPMYPAYERLLSAGINVISLASEATYAAASNPELAAKIDAVAKANGVTFTGSSIWEMSRVWLGILAASPCTDITSMEHRSVTDAGPHPDYVCDYCNVGITQEEFAERMRQGKSIGGYYPLNVMHVLKHLGYEVTDVNERNEPVLFDVPVFCPSYDRMVEPGECAGTRIIAEIQTREGLIATMISEHRLLLDGEKEFTQWTVDGMPGCTITLDRRDSVYATASTLFNRAPDVVAAEPGIKLFSELGPLKHTALIPNIGN